MKIFVPFCAVFLVAWVRNLCGADYSKEALVIRELNTRIAFTTNGESDSHQKILVTLQSEALIRQYGVVAIPYNAGTEQAEFEYVRVHKLDGSVVETPLSSVMDVSTPVAMNAPTYSDLRQKQIPVKALGVGDTLEYAVHTRLVKPDVPGQFWYQQIFPNNTVVLADVLEIRTPKGKYVHIESPKLKPETSEEAGDQVYTWKYSQLEPNKPTDLKKELASPDDPATVRLTTFRTWQEIGEWWSRLVTPEAAVTPTIEAKARELTAGHTSDLDKAKAIYDYVAMRFRYISISLGQGRYRPHSAQEVLSNQYGDCKDKDTLLRSLLKAAGIEAWPALIGADMKFDESAPSLVQFNHVLTVLPQSGKYIWLDSTSEVAPFGMLAQEIRDQQALVIPAKDKPVLMKTPLDPPFVASSEVTVKSSLSTDGALTAHFSFSLFGDDSLSIRGALHELAPSQWELFAQQMSYGLGYAGDVNAVSVDHLEDIDKPLEYSYDYSRKVYSDWPERRITPPIPPLGFGPGEEADKPKEAFWAGAPGKSDYRASIALPKNFSAEVPKDVSASSPFAEYSSHYSFDDGAIHAERVLTIKKAKVEPAQWDEYRKFIKAISDDQRNYTVLLENSKAGAESSSNSSPQAAELIRRAMSELHERKNSAAAADLAQAEQVNPNQPGLWRARAFIASNSPRPEQAAAEFRKDVEAHPDIVEALEAYVAFLVHAHRIDEAIEAVQKGVEHHPENVSLATGAARLLIQQKRYDDALALLQKPLSLAPGNPGLSSERVEALLLTKRPKDRMDAIGEALKLRDSDADPLIRNDVAYALAESGQGIGLAEDLSKNALHDSEEQAAGASLSTLEDADLRRIQVIAAEWDTLGFVYLSQSFFESGSEKQQLLAKAGKYIEASWQLLQNADTAEHLAELYDKIGRRQSATEMWRFALALNPVSQKAKDHLRQAGVPEQITPSIQNPSSPERLVRARTFGIPMLPKQTATADFYVLLSSNGERDAQFISGTESLRSATDTVKSAVKFTFPDDGPEKIIRRGILSCSLYTTPNCQFTLLLPSDVHK